MTKMTVAQCPGSGKPPQYGSVTQGPYDSNGVLQETALCAFCGARCDFDLAPEHIRRGPNSQFVMVSHSSGCDPDQLLQPFCACGRVVGNCDGSRAGCKSR